MRHMTAVTALASSLILATAAVVYAAPSINLKNAAGASASPLELVKKNGGGGGKVAGSGGSFRGGVAASPRGKAIARGGGSLKGGGGGGKGRGKGYSGGGKHRGDFARKGGGGNYARKGGGYYAHKGDGGDHYKHRRHSKFYRYYTPGIFTYGAYSYYDECDWLRRKARVTGSAYWWRRYDECRYYY